MNTIKTLTNNVTNFICEIAAHYGLPEEEISAAISQVNFYALYQTLCRQGRPVYTYHAGHDSSDLMNYQSDRLFPGNAILLYRDEDFSMEADEVATTHYLEVWLREDLTLAVTSCFRVLVEDVDYPSAFRTLKGSEWPYAEEIFDMDIFFHGLFTAAPEAVCVACHPFYEP